VLSSIDLLPTKGASQAAPNGVVLAYYVHLLEVPRVLVGKPFGFANLSIGAAEGVSLQ
jgi:hypothetical protein